MECDLRIGRAIIDVSGRNGLRRTQLVDLDHPGGDMSPRRLPNEARRQSARKREATEKGEPPVLRCGSRRADTIVPDLRGTLVGRDRLRRLAIDRKSTRPQLQSLMRNSYAVCFLTKK